MNKQFSKLSLDKAVLEVVAERQPIDSVDLAQAVVDGGFPDTVQNVERSLERVSEAVPIERAPDGKWRLPGWSGGPAPIGEPD